MSELTVRVAPPVLRMVTVRSALEPRVTVPKSSVSGSTESTPGVGTAPMPVSAAVAVPAELAMVSVPLKVPLPVGVNVEVAVVLAPGASVVPVAGSPLIVNGALGCVAVPIVSGLPPVLAMVMVRVLVWPVRTVPWSTGPGVTASTPGLTPATTLTLDTACWSA